MRLAFVTELYTPSVGGQETRFRSLAETLVAAGHGVEVFCIGHRRDLPAHDLIGGVPVHRHPCVDGYHDTHYGIVSSLVRLARVRIPFALWARRQLERGGFDAVLFNQYPMVHVLLAARITRQRAVMDWCEVRAGVVHRLSRRVLPRMVAANLCVNADGAVVLEAETGQSFTYLPSGVRAGAYRSRPREQRRGVLYLGRLFSNKDLPLLVAGWRQYRENGGTEPLIVAGDGPARDQLEAALAAIPCALKSEVSVLGNVDDEVKIELLASSVLLAVTSKREGFPNVVAEAAASDLPVATIDAPGNGTASVVRLYGLGAIGTPEPGGVAGAIERVIAQWDEYSAHARLSVTELDWTQVANQLVAVLASVAR